MVIIIALAVFVGQVLIKSLSGHFCMFLSRSKYRWGWWASHKVYTEMQGVQTRQSNSSRIKLRRFTFQFQGSLQTWKCLEQGSLLGGPSGQRWQSIYHGLAVLSKLSNRNDALPLVEGALFSTWTYMETVCRPVCLSSLWYDPWCSSLKELPFCCLHGN